MVPSSLASASSALITGRAPPSLWIWAAPTGASATPPHSRELLDRALVIQERDFGPDHREVAVTLMSLGNAYGNLGGAA